MTKSEKHIVGDIKNKDDLKEALQGVDTVFHTAGLVSFGTHPDFEGMIQVNVYGRYSALTVEFFRPKLFPHFDYIVKLI